MLPLFIVERVQKHENIENRHGGTRERRDIHDKNPPRSDGTKPENYRERYLKTRVVLSLSNQDVFGVLNGLTEPTPTLTNTDTPNVPALLRKSTAGSERARICSRYCTSSLAARLPHWSDNTNTETHGEVWETGIKRGMLCTINSFTTARTHGGPAIRSL